jgi:hypothetical protein
MPGIAKGKRLKRLLTMPALWPLKADKGNVRFQRYIAHVWVFTLSLFEVYQRMRINLN